MTRRRSLLAAGATGALVAIAVIVVLAAVGAFDSSGGGGGGGRAGLPTVPPASAKGSGSEDIHAIYEHVAPSSFLVQARIQGGAKTGTAWLYDDHGHLVTNDHVVSNSSAVALRVGNSRLLPVKVVGADPSSDLAVLAVDPSQLHVKPLTLGDSSTVQVGAPVVAIGNPFGLVDTVTSGIVSAKQRHLQAPNGYPIAGAIQTDAPINPGNSGGPLLDAHGRVIGVNSQIATGGSGDQSAGVGFAIPISTVKRVAPQLIAHGEVKRAFLGVTTVSVTPALAQRLGLSVRSGALVVQVAPGSPASRAGLRGSGGTSLALLGGGDIIVGVDGKRIGGSTGLAGAIGSKKPGTSARITYVRGGARHTVTVRLATK